MTVEYAFLTAVAMVTVAVVYLTRLALLRTSRSNTEDWEDLKDQVGALEDFGPQLRMLQTDLEKLRAELALTQENAASTATLKNLQTLFVNRMNTFELKLAGVVGGRK